MAIKDKIGSMLGRPPQESVALVEVKHDPTPSEIADSRKWLDEIKAARKFDESSRKQYAVDRKYVRGDVGRFEVDVPIAASYIHVLKSFLYAKNPDLDVLPADSVLPPPEDEIRRMVSERANGDPALKQEIVNAAEEVRLAGGQPPQAAQAADEVKAQGIADQVEQIMQPAQERAQQAKSLGKTLEIVIERLWEDARLKREATAALGSGLTVGVGWIKAQWVEQQAEHPDIRAQMTDITERMKRIAATVEDDDQQPEQSKADLEQQLMGLKEQLHYVSTRGLAVQFIPAEDI